MVAHEIRNALVPLRTLVDVLPARFDDPAFRRCFSETVPREIDRMYDMVEQLNGFRPRPGPCWP